MDFNQLILGLSQFLKVPTVLVGGLTMSDIWIGVLVIVCALAAVALSARKLWRKLAAIVLVLLALPTFAIAMSEQLSYPKELSLQWLQSQGAQGLKIYGTVIDAPVRIDLWVEMDGTRRAFYIPWSDALDKSLQNAANAIDLAKKNGGGGDLRLHFEPSLDNKEPLFYPDPWEAPPAKDEAPAQKPREYTPQIAA